MRSTHRVAVPQQDLANIVEALDAAGRARSYEACERGDAAFHRGIALACDNALVLALFDLVNTPLAR